jgi:hypothetical protein
MHNEGYSSRVKASRPQALLLEGLVCNNTYVGVESLIGCGQGRVSICLHNNLLLLLGVEFRD